MSMSMSQETMKYLINLIHVECNGDKALWIVWDEIDSKKTFSINGDEAFQQIKILLEDKYNVKERNYSK